MRERSLEIALSRVQKLAHAQNDAVAIMAAVIESEPIAVASGRCTTNTEPKTKIADKESSQIARSERAASAGVYWTAESPPLDGSMVVDGLQAAPSAAKECGDQSGTSAGADDRQGCHDGRGDLPATVLGEEASDARTQQRSEAATDEAAREREQEALRLKIHVVRVLSRGATGCLAGGPRSH